MDCGLLTGLSPTGTGWSMSEGPKFVVARDLYVTAVPWPLNTSYYGARIELTQASQFVNRLTMKKASRTFLRNDRMSEMVHL